MNPYDFFSPFYQAHYDHALKDIFLNIIAEQSAITSTLEVGCGPGFIALALAEKGYLVTATDISENLLLNVQESALKKGLNVITKTYDILTEPQETYGLVVMVFDVLNHLETLDQFATAITHLIALTKSGGTLIFDALKLDYLRNLIGYQETFNLGEEALIWSVKEGANPDSVRHLFQKENRIQTLNQRTFTEATLRSLIPQDLDLTTVELEDRMIYIIKK